MKDETKFHIDVTPEEDQLFRDIEAAKQEQKAFKPKSNLFVACLVVGIHIAGVCALMALSSDDKQLAKNILDHPSLEQCAEEAKKREEAEPKNIEQTALPAIPVNAPSSAIATAPPPANTDAPMDSAPKKEDVVRTPLDKPLQQANIIPLVTPDVKPKNSSVVKLKPNPNVMKFYVVKKGDTVYSIAKKFKLRTDRLLKLNGIKDPNKIIEGQKLKFL